jgi:hypothetical protein
MGLQINCFHVVFLQERVSEQGRGPIKAILEIKFAQSRCVPERDEPALSGCYQGSWQATS